VGKKQRFTQEKNNYSNAMLCDAETDETPKQGLGDSIVLSYCYLTVDDILTISVGPPRDCFGRNNAQSYATR
jgi:hypothetical protein